MLCPVALARRRRACRHASGRLVRGRTARRRRGRGRTEGGGGGSRGCPRRGGRLRCAPCGGASGFVVSQLRSACCSRAQPRESRGGAPAASPDQRLGDLKTRGGSMARTPLLNRVEDAMGCVAAEEAAVTRREIVKRAA